MPMSETTVQMSHGSGGQMMKRLIDVVFLDAFGAPELHAGNDAGVAELPATGRIALSTDTFVVTPQFFPGGDIGRLAVSGTVNDVATSGAHVRYLSCGFILEEGFPLDDLRRICASMAETAREAGVAIITGPSVRFHTCPEIRSCAATDERHKHIAMSNKYFILFIVLIFIP